ncbi:ATP-binding cassette domain-containing protein [Elioraea sp. Yellowstone]|uniref:phosphonate ABC transporter ATP-binding protein n=1 Tax=Elioraea sp. Yellowstone TaxID=2592070 RepID=UPI001150061F|nr:ATP-binding cassette domain-containing protein [Elioraea sp. Yellowstone]TQF77891.1 ATP-binding cassette domain-containing protein [Elioraea sp. Yellowstone]
MTAVVLDGAATRPAAASTAGPAEIAADGLVKRFGRTAVLDGVSLSVRRGERVALIGANGAGKSTLLRCLVRLVEPDEGHTLLLGEPVGRLGRRALTRLRRRVGFVFQRHNLVPRQSVLTNVVHGALGRAGLLAVHQAVAPAALRAEAVACLDRVGLAALARQRADTLSGGQSQRVAIARALMQRPEVMLADEPVASLDPAAGEEVMALFATLTRQAGVTLLFTTHTMTHAIAYADRVVGLRGGRIVLDAPAHPGLAPVLERFFE